MILGPCSVLESSTVIVLVEFGILLPRLHVAIVEQFDSLVH